MTVAIIVAVREERNALLRRMPLAEETSAGGISFWRGVVGGTEVVLAKSGMGPERARHASEALIEACRPDALLIAGFCAGLAEGVEPGHVVIAEAVAEAPSCGAPREPDAALLRRAERVQPVGVTVHSGTLLSSASVVRRASDKRAIAAKRGSEAFALDMETVAAADAAHARGVPWLAVRAVTDACGDDLPLDFGAYAGPDGEVAPLRLAAGVLARPWAIPGLILLGWRASLAARNLAAFVELYVREMGSHAASGGEEAAREPRG